MATAAFGKPLNLFGLLVLVDTYIGGVVSSPLDIFPDDRKGHGVRDVPCQGR